MKKSTRHLSAAKKKERKSTKLSRTKHIFGEEGFLSVPFLKEFMNKNDRIIILIIAAGILILLVLSVVLIFRKGVENVGENTVATVSPTPVKKITNPYPTVPEKTKDATVVVNSRTISPVSIKIIPGGTIGFYNNDSMPVTIEGIGDASELLNLGEIASYDIPVVTFPKAGVYQYRNPVNPDDIGTIIVE